MSRKNQQQIVQGSVLENRKTLLFGSLNIYNSRIINNKFKDLNWNKRVLLIEILILRIWKQLTSSVKVWIGIGECC